jgi:uncharacterized membrane protein
MDARAKLFGHPIHQMVVVFPLGLLATAVVFDILHRVTGGGVWPTVAFYMIGAGIIGGLLAAAFGVIDWLAIPADTRARRIGRLHGLGNVLVIALFTVSWYLRRGAPESPSTTALMLSFVGGLVAVVTGWLGGELVDRLGVGVDEGAHLDAPSSLSGRPASAPDGGARAPGRA